MKFVNKEIKDGKVKFFLIGVLFFIALLFAVQALNIENQGAMSVDELIVNGNVGIGTEDPESKLHIKGGNSQIILESDSVDYPGSIWFRQIGRPGSLIGKDNNTGALMLKPGNYVSMFLSEEGNVGIGVYPSNVKLDVAGDIKASSLNFANCDVKAVNGVLSCGSDAGITSESDPQVGILTGPTGQWCVSNGTAINCNQSVPSGGVTSVGTGAGLAGGPITSSGTISIANGGVGATQLADNSVTGAKIVNGVVTTGKTNFANQNLLTTSSPTFTSLTTTGNVVVGYQVISQTSAGGVISFSVLCPTDKKAIGGGCHGNTVPISSSTPGDSGNGWFCTTSAPATITAKVICARIA